MTIAHLLEDFSIQLGDGAFHWLDDNALEEQKLAAFEKGYGAGWEDALQAQEQNRGQLSADLAASLSDLSFTYHEAITRMTLSLEPMFQSLVQTVLPETLDRSLALRLSEQLTDMAKEQIGQPLQLIVPKGTAAQIEPILPKDLPTPPQIVEDPTLQSGQARLQVGVTQREVDCAALLKSIGDAFDAYVFEANEALANE